MALPQNAGSRCAAAAADTPAERASLQTLKHRADFLKVARARRCAAPGLMLQARQRSPDEPASGDIRIGYTCSKKVGNAVARNRAKRRLRAVAREIMPSKGHAGWDYVLIGRAGATAERPYPELLDDLRGALGTIHGGGQ